MGDPNVASNYSPENFVMGMVYASDYARKMRCLRKNMDGTAWVPKPENRPYPCFGLEECLRGADGKGAHGNCRISTADRCSMSSVLPFDPETGDYPDWPECAVDSDCAHLNIPSVCAASGAAKSVAKNADEATQAEAEKKHCAPARPYLEWHPDPSKKFQGTCVMGNSMLYRWCEYPGKRSVQAFKMQCDGDPACRNERFDYHPDTSTCTITKGYCDRMGLDFKDGPPPDCYESTGQKVGEFFLGKTIFRAFKRGKGPSGWLDGN